MRSVSSPRSRSPVAPPTTWAAAIAAVVYTFAPLDLIPELVLGPLGFGDDLGVWSVFGVLLVREHHRWQAAVRSA